MRAGAAADDGGAGRLVGALARRVERHEVDRRKRLDEMGQPRRRGRAEEADVVVAVEADVHLGVEHRVRRFLDAEHLAGAIGEIER